MLIYIFINKADYTSGFSQKKFNLKFACCAFYFIKILSMGHQCLIYFTDSMVLKIIRLQILDHHYTTICKISNEENIK